jgi:hypothetical protein
MLPSIEAYYRNGVVVLSERPQGIAESRVIVTFIDSSNGEHAEPQTAGTRASALKGLRALFADIPRERSLADELIAQRRAEARHA